MNRKEKRAEEQELESAVRVLRATLRSMARKKAQRYEMEFLGRVRDIIDEEIRAQEDATEVGADYLAREVKKVVTEG